MPGKPCSSWRGAQGGRPRGGQVFPFPFPLLIPVQRLLACRWTARALDLPCCRDKVPLGCSGSMADTGDLERFKGPWRGGESQVSQRRWTGISYVQAIQLRVDMPPLRRPLGKMKRRCWGGALSQGRGATWQRGVGSKNPRKRTELQEGRGVGEQGAGALAGSLQLLPAPTCC